MESPRTTSGTLLVQTLGVFWRQTTVDLRYVPVSVSHDAEGTEKLSLLAVLVIFRGRLQPELMDPGLPRDAAVYPLTTPSRNVSARFSRLSTAAEARFSFGIEWHRVSTSSGDDDTASSETPELRVLFRATSASEYARWKQVLGEALAMPVTQMTASSERRGSYQALGKSMVVPTALSKSVGAPGSEPLAPERHVPHNCADSCRVMPIDEASSPNGNTTLATQRSPIGCHGTADGASVPSPLRQHKRVLSPSENADDAANECEAALVTLPPARRVGSALASRGVAVHPMDCFTVFDARRARLEHARSHESVPRPLNSFRLQLHATLAVPARDIAPAQRAYRKSISASQIDVDRRHSEVASNKLIEPRNAGTVSHQAETSNTDEAHARSHSTASVRVDVQAIVRYFESFSWQPRTLPSGLETQPLPHSSLRTKRQWRSAHSMPARLDTLPFSERDGFSWRVTPASQLRQQRYQSIREVNRGIERRVRELMNDPTPLEDIESGCLPALLPGLTIQPWNVPPSTRSAFEEFCCH